MERPPFSPVEEKAMYPPAPASVPPPPVALPAAPGVRALHRTGAVVCFLINWPLGVPALIFSIMSASSRTNWKKAYLRGDLYAAQEHEAKSNRYCTVCTTLSLIGILVTFAFLCLLLLGREAATTSITPIG